MILRKNISDLPTRKILNLTPEKHTGLLELSRKFLFVFFIVGQSSYNPYVTDSGKQTTFYKLLQYLPSVCFGIVVYTSAFTAFYGFTLGDLSMDKAIYFIIIYTRVITCSTLIRRTPLFDDQTKLIILKFKRLEQFSFYRLRVQISFVSFARSYRRKLTICLLSFATLFFAKFTTRFNSANYIRQISALSLLFSTFLAILQILFYIHLMKYVIRQISKNFASILHGKLMVHEIERWTNLTHVENYKNFKQIHYRLWELTQLINEQFGWVLVALVLQNLLNTIQPIYWIIVELHKDDIPNNLRILSKYIIINLLC